MKVTVMVLLLVTGADAAFAGQWRIEPDYQDRQGVYIRYGVSGHDSLAVAIAAIEADKTLLHINMSRLVQIESADLQADLLNYLQQNHANVLASALAVAASTSSHEMNRLRAVFSQALAQTGFFKNIDKTLGDNGYRIKSMSFEKFFIVEDSEPIQFDAITWLVIEKLRSAV